MRKIISWDNKDSFLTGTFHIHCTEFIVVTLLLSLIVLHIYVLLWIWRPQPLGLYLALPPYSHSHAYLLHCPKRNISEQVLAAQETGLFGNFNLWLPLHSLLNDLITKWPEFHTLSGLQRNQVLPYCYPTHRKPFMFLWSDKFGTDVSFPVGVLPL